MPAALSSEVHEAVAEFLDLGASADLRSPRAFWTVRRAISAIAEDRQGAVLRGIDPVLLTRVSWFAGGALAALAGVLAGPIMYASVSLGPSLLITGFAAVAIGGVGDNRGAMAGGYLLALVEGLTAARIAADLTDVATFVVLLVVLLVKPTGLFGERQVARV
jgi:branched-chain amino acid transport system permease protein